MEDLILRGYFKNYTKWNNEKKGKVEAENKRNLSPNQDEGDAKRQKKAPIFVIFEKSEGIIDGKAHLRLSLNPPLGSLKFTKKQKSQNIQIRLSLEKIAEGDSQTTSL